MSNTFATPPPPSTRDQSTCPHQHISIFFFTETCHTYRTNGGKVLEHSITDEPELTDEVAVWCIDCHLDAIYADWRAAPAGVRVLCKQIRMEHWDEEDDGSFTVLLAAEGGQA